MSKTFNDIVKDEQQKTEILEKVRKKPLGLIQVSVTCFSATECFIIGLYV